MLNERTFIARVEAADAREFGRLLQGPDREEEIALRAHLGDDVYERMHELAAVQPQRGGEPRGNVVVIVEALVICGKVPKPLALVFMSGSTINYEWENQRPDFLKRVKDSVQKSPF